jgi:non-specific serine/threonine protein kinase
VFVGGCTLEAAESICAATASESTNVLDRMAGLVEKSLLLAEPSPDGMMRYRLLEPLRQYGRERLELDGDANAMRDRHATFFLSLAERAAAALVGPDGPAYRAWLGQLEREHDNLRAALRWLVAQGRVESAQRLGGALRYFWLFRGYVSEGRAWLTEIAVLPEGAVPTAAQARVLSGTAMLAVVQGDYDAAWEWAQEAETLWSVLDNPWERAIALLNLGTSAAARGERDKARALHEEGVRVSRAAGDRTTEALHLHGLSELAFAASDYPTARARAEEALALCRELEWASPRNSPQILGLRGEVSLEEGDLSSARAYFEESLARARAIGWPWGIALALVRVGHVASEQGDVACASEVFREALAMHRAQGNRAGLVSSLVGLAHLEVRCGRPERALRLAGAVTVLRASLHAPPSATEAGRLERWIALSTEALGEDAASELAAGGLLSLDQAIDYALAPPDAGPAAAAQAHLLRAAGPPISRLTPREEAVVALVAEGLTNRQIADELVISERTVESHVRHALEKLGAQSRIGLATWAVEHLTRTPRPR